MQLQCHWTHTAVWEDDIAEIIILYLSPSLYIAIPYFKEVPYILKERAWKAVSLTQNWNLDLIHCQFTTYLFLPLLC